MPAPLAPVLLFAYNRPDHVKRTLASLRANRLAERSRLIVFCDGPPPEASEELLARLSATRETIRSVQGFADVQIHEAPVNRGLMRSIEDGVRAVLAESSNVIVLEDDLELSPGFLTFMNDALSCYSEAEEVMHVSGYMFPLRQPQPETFFLRIMSSWGWGTWRRAFVHYESDAARLQAAILRAERTEEFNLEGEYNYMRQLRANAEGRLRSWAVKWYASMFLRGGLGLFPQRSLVRNLGHDASGQNSARTRRFDVADLAERVAVAPIPLVENVAARRAVGRFLGPNLYRRLSGRWRRWLGQLTARPARCV